MQAILNDLWRQKIDVRIMLSFERKRGLGVDTARTFQLVGLHNEKADEYHLYLTSLAGESYSAPNITQLYRARWEVELLFRELKSRFGLDEIKTADGYTVEALVVMSVVSLIMSRVIVGESRSLEARQRESKAAVDADSSVSRLPRHRCSLAIERHAYLVQPYFMAELGYGLLGLNKLLLWASRNPNPYRDQLHEQVERGEFDFNRY